MRVLFYGGCHADVLHKIFSRFCLNEDFSSSLLVNFVTISEGGDFPYDRLDQHDVVVFNPIMNKGKFNTSHLIEACRARGVKTVSYPWLQWNGYFPGSRRLPGIDWVYPELIERRGEHADFATFKDWALGDWLTPEIIEENIATTTRILREHERDAACDIRISDFILSNYKARRLFVTPDHPAADLYKYVAHEIAARLNVKLDKDFDALFSEFQQEHYLPVMPQVARTLELSFPASEYAFKAILGARSYSLGDALKMFYFGGESVVMLTPEWGERVRVSGKEINVVPGQLLFGRQEGKTLVVLDAPNAIMRGLPGDRRIEIMGSYWQKRELSAYLS